MTRNDSPSPTLMTWAITNTSTLMRPVRIYPLPSIIQGCCQSQIAILHNPHHAGMAHPYGFPG